MKRAQSRKLTVSAVLGILLLPRTTATPLRPTFTSCLNSYQPVAPEAEQLRINDVLATVVTGQEASEEGLQGDGVQVLRIDLVGESASVLEGYNNDTNKLGT